MKSIRWKLVFMYVALVFIVMMISGVFMLLRIQERERENARADLESYARNITREIIEPVFDENPSADVTLETFADALYSSSLHGDTLTEACIIRVSPYSIRTVAATFVYEPPFPEYTSHVIIAAQNADVGEASFGYNAKLADTADGRKYPRYEYARPAYASPDDDTRLIVYVWRDATQSDDNIAQITRIFALSVLIALLFTVALGVAFSSSITGPISTLAKAAQTFALGNLKSRVEVKTSDEIGRLNNSFNVMAEEISQAMSDINGEKSKLEILFNNMTDGALAFDAEGALVRANDVCADLLALPEGYEMNDLTFAVTLEILGVKPEEGLSVTEAAAALAESGDAGATVGEKYLNISFNVNKNNEGAEGVVIVLQDITRHMKLDNMRKDFVANVSHELRTPLTTIKSYAETIVDSDALIDRERRREFLTIIIAEADRMTNIVKDLLELSKFDNKRLDLNLAETDLRDVTAQCVKNNGINAKRLGKKVTFARPDFDAPALIDAGRVAQVLNNIISNSLKYSARGAHVEIWFERDAEGYIICVKDDGLGIPKDDLRHIFDRFYRVDKARSRELGGTGLGLSIAKEIMDAHGGSISAISELGKGTTMILRFKKPDKEELK